MSNPPPRPCAHPGCARLVASGRCAAHRRAYEDQRPNADIRGWYLTPRWRRLRAEVLRRSPFCVVCEEEGRRVPATDADHIRPHAGDSSLFWSLENLQGLCHSHHARKTRAESLARAR